MSSCPVLLSSCPPRPRCTLRRCVPNFKKSRFALETGGGMGYNVRVLSQKGGTWLDFEPLAGMRPRLYRGSDECSLNGGLNLH